MLMSNLDLTEGESFINTYPNLSEKVEFPTPDTYTFMCVSGGKKC